MWRLSNKLSLFCWLAIGLPMASAQTNSSPVRAHNSDSDRHMLLLLSDRLLHLHVQITDQGESLAVKREKYMQQLIKRLDANQDGKLSSAETGKHPLFVQGRRFEGNKFLESLKTRKPFSSSEVEQAVERAAGKLVTYRQNSLVSDQDKSVFRVLDADGSGQIDRLEMRTATARIAVRDKDFDQCITRDEFLDDLPANNGGLIAATSEPPESVHSEMLRDASEPIVAQQVMRRYDSDQDKLLSDRELGWPSERVRRLDTNGDGKINVAELIGLSIEPPDLSLTVDLHRDQLSLRLLGGTQANDLESKNERVLASKSGQLPVSLQLVDRDCIAESIQNSQVAFNAIDVDTNGYLDRTEIAAHQRFERYLFDAMDANDDDRVFASEMQAYVKEYTEPATTTCQVTIFSMGFGVFQILDDNGDGRISVRELRGCEQSLLERSSTEQTIDGGKLGSSYRIEFQRGGVGLFGRVDRPQAQAQTATLAVQSGPIWFQRMDRNGDGDLIWDEFLGPRDVFHELDTDGDSLVDSQEATAYEKKLSSK